MSDNNAQEALIDQYVQENRTSEAVQLLYELILSYAEKRDFAKAEALHEKLYAVDPMALTEIVRAGEAIDEAKNQSVDPAHREIWKSLYEMLSVKEGNALYYAMKDARFEAGDIIIDQGQISNRLFFINRGNVKAVFSSENKEVLLNLLGEGDFFGNDQFFSATVSTVSVIAQGSVKASCLENGVIKKWKTEAPALESKLFDYCQKNDKIKSAVAEKGMERREHSRIPLPVKMIFQLFDGAGEKIEKFYKGDVSDISEGGLSFFIKTTKAETVRMLLGRRLLVSFSANLKNGETRLVEKSGQVTAVQAQVFDDFSIHLRFDTPLEKALVNSLKAE